MGGEFGQCLQVVIGGNGCVIGHLAGRCVIFGAEYMAFKAEARRC